MTASPKTRLLINIIILLAILELLVLTIPTFTVPLFSDGATHAYIIREVSRTGDLPIRDPLGSTVFTFMASVSGERPFMYPPLFYSLGAVLNVFFEDELMTLLILNIVPIFLCFLVFFKIIETQFGYRIGLISLIFLILTSEWLWFIVHRLQEPILFFIILLLLHFCINCFQQKKDKTFEIVSLCALFSVVLISLKQTTFPIVFATTTYFLLKNRKIGTYFILLILLMLIPSFTFVYQATGTLSPAGTTQTLDNIVFNPWWTWEKANWEVSLDKLVDVSILTKNQYFNAQPSFLNLIEQKEYFALVGNILSYHPIHYKLFRGFYSPNSSNTYSIFLVLFMIGTVIFLKKFNENKSNSFFLVLISIVFLTYLAWMVTGTGTVRYFTYTAVIFTFLYGLSTYYITTLLRNKILKCIFVIVVVVSLSTNFIYEYERDLNYKNTLGHQYAGEGALIELVDASNIHRNYTNSDIPIFTPMTEVAYYFDTPIIWDYRLFFLSKEDLKYYLPHYNFTLIIVPSYSGVIPSSRWTYVSGIPKDSPFNELLKDRNYFIVLKEYNTFTIYERVK